MQPESLRHDDPAAQFDVDYRPPKRASRERVVLARKKQPNGRRRLANQSRYNRGGKAAFFNGAHRRRKARIR